VEIILALRLAFRPGRLAGGLHPFVAGDISPLGRCRALVFRDSIPDAPRRPPGGSASGKDCGHGIRRAGIGFLAGLTGTGGGIFLTPLLLLFRWAHTKNAAAVSAVFILMNSTSGLLGYLHSGRTIPALAWPLAVAAILGGLAGSYFGSRKFPVRVVRILLAVVLAIAGTKLFFTLS